MAHERRARLDGNASEDEVQAVTRFGQPYKVYGGDLSAFRIEVAKRIAALNADAGLPYDWSVPLQDRARIRAEVATDLFRVEHGRDPEDAREIAATIAKHSRPRATAVAGYEPAGAYVHPASQDPIAERVAVRRPRQPSPRRF